MSTPAKRRLMRDFQLISDASINCYAAPLENDILSWIAVIIGPKDTIFEDGLFFLQITFTEKYPDVPPEVKFITEMFHPNVYQNGDLCLDILKSRWSPNYDMHSILISIQSLLNDPNINSPANKEAADMYANNRNEYEKKVKENVEDSWFQFDGNIKFIGEYRENHN